MTGVMQEAITFIMQTDIGLYML